MVSAVCARLALALSSAIRNCRGSRRYEYFARLDVLVVGDVDVLDDAWNVGGDADRVGFDIGVVRRHHLTAGDIPITAGDQRERRQRKQRPPCPRPARRPRRFLGRGRHRGRGLRLVSCGASRLAAGASAVSERSETMIASSGIKPSSISEWCRAGSGASRAVPPPKCRCSCHLGFGPSKRRRRGCC